MSRPSREEYYMAIATLASLRSTCLSRKVGAIIVKDDNPISFGYNGPARGVPHCEEEGGCLRRAKADYASGKYLEICPASHAEQNAIAFAALHGISTKDSTIYVTTFPCKDCMNSLINAGIKKIVYNGDYNAEISKNISNAAMVEVEKYSGRDINEILLANDFIHLEGLPSDLKVEIVKKLYKLLSKEEQKNIK